jgi:hypothetical protein
MAANQKIQKKARRLAAILLFVGFVAGIHGQQSLDQILKNGVAVPSTTQQDSGMPIVRTARTLPPGEPTAATAQTSAGFHMDLPSGWHAQRTQGAAVVARSADGASSVIIAPVFNVANGAAAEWLRLRGSAVLNSYLKNASVSAVYPSRTRPNAALAYVEFSGVRGPGIAHVMHFVAGNTGTLYVIACPRQAMEQENGMPVQILGSFSFTGERAPGSSASAQPSLNFSRFNDPYEAAFSVDVPEGWKVQGGTMRRSTLDFRMLVYTMSPDGTTVIRLGDPSLGTFVEPSQLLAMAGMREGMDYHPGYGNTWPIRRYLPGSQFAQMYASKLTREVRASSLQFKSVRPLPEFSAQSSGGAVLTMAGEAAFTCARNGRQAAGAVYAATQRWGTPAGIRDPTMPGGGPGAMWFAIALGDFVSPVENAAQMNEAVLHMMKSFQINPQWLARQSQMAVDTSRIARDVSEHFSKVSNESFGAGGGPSTARIAISTITYAALCGFAIPQPARRLKHRPARTTTTVTLATTSTRSGLIGRSRTRISGSCS